MSTSNEKTNEMAWNASGEKDLASNVEMHQITE